MAQGTAILRVINHVFHVDTEGFLVKTSNNERIPDEEPVFLFRGRDRLAIPGLIKYRELAVSDACNEYMLDRIDVDLKHFEIFRDSYPERMKQPGVTRGK